VQIRSWTPDFRLLFPTTWRTSTTN
jgi:hypothetical protein